MRTAFNERQDQFSPDTRWVAYSSDESGTWEIYVQQFPATSGSGGKWLVSNGGGYQPHWRGDGRELFYLSPDRRLMAVAVTTRPTFQPGVPRSLFVASVYASATDYKQYDVTADGKKSLFTTDPPDSASSPITVVLNWTEGLKR